VKKANIHAAFAVEARPLVTRKIRPNLMLFNTMSQKKEPLKVAPGETLRMFVCGPTVQSFIHVGNARTHVFYDVLARYLNHLGTRVNFLMNITDVDDRITEAARKEGVKPGDIVEKYTKSFLEDLRSLGVTSVTSFERVSDYVPVMIDQISLLLASKHAYLADGVVYFDTSKFPDYGKLSHQSKSDLSLRPLELTPNKKNLLDFSLWRPEILEEGKWDSPWGRGSPGWHIEDTAVSLTNFGPQYDIHGGAYELVYPHHEAEIAQGESLTGKRPLVRYWVHSGLVNLSGRKMSKSAGNTYLVRELLREFSADELRYYLLSWRRREDMEFSIPRLRSSSKAYAKAVGRAERLKERGKTDGGAGGSPEGTRRILSPFYAAMDDDIDTPRALEWVEEELLRSSSSDATSRYSALRVVSDVLGVHFAKP
jgi:cysteinyl-tRNA synthetase